MPGQIDSLYRVQKKDISRARVVLTDAFQHDPIWNAVFKEVPQLAHRLSTFYEIPVRHCLKFGAVYATSEALEGIAAWVPGKFADMTIWRMLRSGALFAGLKIGAKMAIKMKPALEPIEKDRHEIMKGKVHTR